MFCHKCGKEIEDGAMFCQNCGTPLMSNNKVQTIENIARPVCQPKKASSGKKKVLKVMGILGVIAIIAVIVMFNWEGELDYKSTVRAYQPFKTYQGLPYTLGEVVDKYVVDPTWEVREAHNIHYVDIQGILKGTNIKIAITVSISPHPDSSDMCLFDFESVTIDGIKQTGQNIDDILYALFIAYDEGYADLSILME